MIRLNIDQQIELMDREPGRTFSGLWLIGEDARTMSRDELSNQYDDDLSGIIEGYWGDRRAEISRTVRNDPECGLDRITAALLADACCDPLTAIALAIELQSDAVIECSATDDMVATIDPWCGGTVVHLSDDVRWCATGRIHVQQVPLSALSAAIGGPLSAVVGHPVLDRFPLVVTAIEGQEDERATIVVDADDSHIPLEELAALKPPGAKLPG